MPAQFTMSKLHIPLSQGYPGSAKLPVKVRGCRHLLLGANDPAVSFLWMVLGYSFFFSFRLIVGSVGTADISNFSELY